MPEDRLTRLKKIRDLIEKKTRAEHVSRLENIEEVVARIRKSKKLPFLFHKKRGKEMDFAKVPFLQKDFLYALNRFYSAFKEPVSRISKSVSMFPIAHGIELTLERAGWSIKPETFVVSVVSLSLIAGFFTLFLASVAGLFSGHYTLLLAAPLLAVLTFLAVLMLSLLYPGARASQRARKIDRVLPFALRQIATQVKAGVSFNKAIYSVVKGKYGVLSQEFGKLLSDVDRGVSLEEALTRLARRTKSTSLNKAITQIIRSLKTGGDLSQIISDIAEDASFETRMRIRDFTEKLNFINIVYIMLAVVAPVATTILSAILQIPLFAAGFPVYLVYFTFLGIIIGLILLLYITKQMEPAAW